MLNTGRDKFSWVVIAWGAILLILNFKLIQQNKILGAQAATPERALHLKPGAELPALFGYDANGNLLNIGYGEDPRKTLLLVFAPQCRACKENMPTWQAMLRQIDRSAYRVVAVSVRPEETKEYLLEHGFGDLPVIADLDAKSKAAYNLAVTPQTILLSPQGVAERVWLGRLNSADARDLAST